MLKSLCKKGEGLEDPCMAGGFAGWGIIPGKTPFLGEAILL